MFISALIGILQYIKVLPFIVRYIGLVLSKVNGMGKLESYNAVASAILGQSEVFISVKQIALIPKHRMYTLCASAMSTVSMSIVGAYMTMIEPRYVVTALVLNLFGGFIIASIVNPYKVEKDEDILEVQEEEKQSFFEMLGEYIMDGFKVAITVAAMLLGFVALIAMINGIFDMIFGITFQELLGFILPRLLLSWAYLGKRQWMQATSWLRSWYRTSSSRCSTWPTSRICPNALWESYRYSWYPLPTSPRSASLPAQSKA